MKFDWKWENEEEGVKKPRHAAWRILGVSFLVAVLLAGFLLFNFSRPPFGLAKLERLRPGMSQAEIKGVLGAPRYVYEDSWAYSRVLAWPMVHVYFDEKGRYSRSEFDY